MLFFLFIQIFMTGVSQELLLAYSYIRFYISFPYLQHYKTHLKYALKECFLYVVRPKYCVTDLFFFPKNIFEVLCIQYYYIISYDTMPNFCFVY